MTVHIIVGPPAAGKSTYIAENAGPGDFRVDLDVLRRALGAEKAHVAPYEVSVFARKVRDLAIEAALAGEINGDSWIIHTNPNAEQIAAYREAGAEFVLIDPGVDAVLAQAEADGRPEWTEKAVRDWYADPPNIEVTSEPPKGGIFYARKEGPPMKIKTAPVTVKAGAEDQEQGEFEAYASTFTREPDAYGDVVAAGAFTETLKEWEQSGNIIPILWGHDFADPFSNIGGVVDAAEDDHGLRIKGKLDLENPTASQVYRLMKGKRVAKMSFAFDVLDSAQVTEEGEKVNELRELKLYEVSVVPLPANDSAEILAVKAATDAALEGVKAGRVLAQKHIDSLRNAQEAIGAVIDAATVEDDQDVKASGQGEVKLEEPETVKGEGQSVNPSVEALAAKEKLLGL